jgi:hypothetical protein
MSNKTISIGELFTVAEIALAAELYKNFRGTGCFAAECERCVVAPALSRINATTGQQNDARYWAYALEFALGSVPL